MLGSELLNPVMSDYVKSVRDQMGEKAFNEYRDEVAEIHR